MDWIKIKTKHYFYSDLTLAEVGLLIKMQCLAAQLEKMPTEKQLLKIPGNGSSRMQSINNKLTSEQQSINNILTKVLQDVNKVSTKRDQAKKKMAQWREKKADVTSNVTSIDKIRVDKIRVDKIIYLDFVYMTQNEHDKLIDKFGDKKTNNLIERLNDYIGSKGVKYKSHYHTILNWDRKDSNSVGSKTFKQIDQENEKETFRKFLAKD